METKIKSRMVLPKEGVQPDIRKNGSNGNRKIVLFVAILIFLPLLYSFLEPYWIEYKVYTINDPDIPSAFDRARIVFLADIHRGPFFSGSRVRKVVEKVNHLDPQLILLGGDYVEGSPEYIDDCFEELAKLTAPLGVYGVLGNHDHWQGADKTRQAMADNGIRSIDNNAFWIMKDNQRIRVGGVGDHCEDDQYPGFTIDSVAATDFTVLVSHSPDYAMELDSDKVDLVLAGHTHGGQITFFGLYAPRVPSGYGQKFRTGRTMINDMSVIISNGVGTVSLPIRFFARPQVLIIQLLTSTK